MIAEYLWRGALIGGLCVLLSMRVEAQTGTGRIEGPVSVAVVVGVVVAAAALIVVTTVLLHKHSVNRSITGCVNSDETEMSLTDEKDHRRYRLSGQTAGIKPGQRMTLQGKGVSLKETGSKFVWDTRRVVRDFGSCQPQS